MKKISVCKARCDIHNLFGLSGLLQTVKAICSCKNSATLPVAPALKTWPNFQSKTQQDLARLDISRLKRNLSGIAWRLLSLSRTCHKGFDPMARFSCLDVAWCCMTSLSPHRAFLRLDRRNWTAWVNPLKCQWAEIPRWRKRSMGTQKLDHLTGASVVRLFPR